MTVTERWDGLARLPGEIYLARHMDAEPHTASCSGPAPDECPLLSGELANELLGNGAKCSDAVRSSVSSHYDCVGRRELVMNVH
jgi:hypothetical protein